MKKEDIHWGDWYRLLIGSAPETFSLEVFLCVCYNCGFLETHDIKSTRTLCNNCGDLIWVDAVL